MGLHPTCSSQLITKQNRCQEQRNDLQPCGVKQGGGREEKGKIRRRRRDSRRKRKQEKEATVHLDLGGAFEAGDWRLSGPLEWEVLAVYVPEAQWYCNCTIQDETVKVWGGKKKKKSRCKRGRVRDSKRVRKQQSPGDERQSTKQWIQNNAQRCAEIEQRLKTCQDKDKPPPLKCHFTAILSENKWQSWQVSAALKETESYFIHKRIFYSFYSKDHNLLLGSEFLNLVLNYWHLHNVQMA